MTRADDGDAATARQDAPDLLSRFIAQWDGNATPPDRILQTRIEEEIAAGLAVPQWIWPVPGPYNGSSGVERIKGWQITKVALQRGWLDRRACCSICQSRTRVQRHSELYGRPLLARPVCRECHFALHRRFRAPQEWRALCDVQPPTHWIRRLPMSELTNVEARCLEQQANPLGLVAPARDEAGRCFSTNKKAPGPKSERLG
jgi:hypothetical protein